MHLEGTVRAQQDCMEAWCRSGAMCKLEESSYMSTLEKARAIAAEAHAGVLDKGGSPYVLHPLRVMLQMETPVGQIAAVLHDVVEDTAVTLQDLKAAGFPSEVIEAVDALTKRDGERRLDAAARARANPIARAVKLADVADNMNLDRIAQPTEKDFGRLREYQQVLEYLRADP